MQLGNQSLALQQNSQDVKALFDGKGVLFMNQSIPILSEVLLQNFNSVNSYFKVNAEKYDGNFDLDDIEKISIEIVLDYLYIYNIWKNKYTRPKYQDLSFKDEDFTDSRTFDIVTSYYKEKFRDSWKTYSTELLGMDTDAFDKTLENRTNFYNM